jgi:hypothetical protein
MKIATTKYLTNRKSFLKIFFVLDFGFTYLPSMAWGFWAHQRINRLAVFTLPPEMMPLFKENIEYLTEHAVDPDKRRYAIKEEAPRHYIDLDHYCVFPCKDFPHYWKDAVAKYSEDTLQAYGIVPWQVIVMMNRLTDAFKEKDKRKILKTAADLGHYVADAHVPLHTSENYNGQMTNQVGIHGFWESRVPELLGEDYDYFVGKADLIKKPNDWIWNIIMDSHQALDTVLSFEKKLSANFPMDRMYSYEQRGETNVKVFSEEYTKSYDKMMGDLVERRMRSAILDVGSIWYSCWVNAGQPDLSHLQDTPLSPQEKQQEAEEEKLWRQGGKQLGRPHDETGKDGIK